MADHHDADFKSEYAKSSRASCKMCRGGITKETLRLAIMVQSPMFDGKIPNWYHFNCFWKRARVTSTNQIHGFDALRWPDQQKIKDKISGGGGVDGPAVGDDGGVYATEYAKSGKSTCRGCQYNIDKDEVRISRKDFLSQRAKMYGAQDLWHHVDCFVKDREELGFGTDLEPSVIKGFAKLQKEDQEDLISKLGKGEKKKRKAEDDGGKKTKSAKTKENPEEKALRDQSEALWKVRDVLSKEVSNNALKGLLEFNSQELPAGESKLLDRVSDAMVFGALKPCPECEGQLAYRGDGYRCTGNITEWTKCLHVTRAPKRKAFKVPEEFHDVDFLKNYKYKPRERVFPASTASSHSSLVSSASTSGACSLGSLEETSSGPRSLAGMKFVLIGKLKRPKSEVNTAMAAMGGQLVTKIDSSVAACISTKEEVAKDGRSMKQAKKADVHVVGEDFLDAVKKGGAALLIKQHSICDWGSDPHDRIGDVTDGPAAASKSVGKSYASKRDDAMFTKSMPAKIKLKLKGGAAVDPDSGLESTAHVLEQKGDIFNAVLGLVDIARGTNSYYKLQILESDKSSRWWTFRAWGRVGTTIGNNKLQVHGSKAAAIENFRQVYGEKTGNDWADRNSFVKYPNKFYPLDIDYGADEEEVKQLDSKAGSNSKLPKSVQDLVKMIFDVESMKKAMLEFEIDLRKMPLGKLSKKQIQSAYKVLNELQELIEKKASPTLFLDASNRFYTLIPHDFGMKKPPMLDSAEIIKAKTDMLDNLLEIEVAYSLMKSGDEGTKDPIDVHYQKLKTNIEELPRSSEEFQNLLKYVKNTHAATHNQYDLEVLDVWKVARDGEAKRFRPFRDLHNRQLLWHGSRTTNYAGILSQGLRIAPPEAPVTGYMFGKGIYFADMVSKSANYCWTNKSDPVGVMLLCEVALGNMYELEGAKYIQQLPKGMHSTKGCGRTGPDPAATITDKSGVALPIGKGMDTSHQKSSLLYNEYIVYDIAQVNIKYALKMNFKYKW